MEALHRGAYKQGLSSSFPGGHHGKTKSEPRTLPAVRRGISNPRRARRAQRNRSHHDEPQNQSRHRPRFGPPRLRRHRAGRRRAHHGTAARRRKSRHTIFHASFDARLRTAKRRFAKFGRPREVQARWKIIFRCARFYGEKIPAEISWRRGWESNPRIKVLQTSPLPLGYRAFELIV
jgi:hypothetical protein